MTCKKYHDLTKELSLKKPDYYYYPDSESSRRDNIYVKRIDDPLVKHTWELCKDGNFDKIPEHYYNKSNELLCLGLILSGNVKLLQKALDMGCTLHSDTCSEAAKFGYLAIVKLGQNNGCKLDYYVAYNSAYNGHLNVLRWAIKNDCGKKCKDQTYGCI